MLQVKGAMTRGSDGDTDYETELKSSAADDVETAMTPPECASSCAKYAGGPDDGWKYGMMNFGCSISNCKGCSYCRKCDVADGSAFSSTYPCLCGTFLCHENPVSYVQNALQKYCDLGDTYGGTCKACTSDDQCGAGDMCSKGYGHYNCQPCADIGKLPRSCADMKMYCDRTEGHPSAALGKQARQRCRATCGLCSPSLLSVNASATASA